MMQLRFLTLILALALTAGVTASVARAQELPSGDGPGAMIGIIPGTAMLRDEFRARGATQLQAVALSAHAYRLLNDGLFPASFEELKRSEAWGFDLVNMFTGRPLQSVYFVPGKNDYTNDPYFAVPIQLYEPPPPTLDDLVPGGEFNPETLGQMFENPGAEGQLRVDPGVIDGFSGGDIFYYISGDLLQLVMFAPDGTYIEHLDQTPNAGWLERLGTPGGSLWPDSVLAAQALFFMDRLLPQHYNLVQFMGNNETMPDRWFEEMAAAERLGLATELGITVLNPFTRAPITMELQPSLGDFVQLDPAAPVPLRIGMRDNQAWSLDELHNTPAVAEPVRERERAPRTAPKRPPLGG